MRLPFLQVDTDFLTTSAGDLAEVLRTSEAEAGWACVKLWGWALTKATTVDNLGLLADAETQRLAERAAGWKGEPGAFLAALEKPVIGLLEREEGGGMRLLGMERYAAVLRRQEADRARKSNGRRAAVRRKSAGSPQEVPPQIETQKKTQTQREDPPKAPQGVLHIVGDKAAAGLAEKPEALMAAWNEHAHADLPRCRELSEARRKRARQRLAERPLAEFVEAIRRMGSSSFLRGRTNSGTWKASFEWLLQPDSVVKVLEGKYDDGPSAAKTSLPPTGTAHNWDDLPPVNSHLVDDDGGPY